MGGRCAIHVPSCGRQTCLLLLVALLPPQAWPLLIKVYWAIQIWYEVCICLGLRIFFFLQEHCGHWGIFWEGHHAASGCCSIAMPSSHSHSHITSAWFASSPLHPPFTYPFHTTRSGSASLTSST